jgi:thiamine kinase-like enzyme
MLPINNKAIISYIIDKFPKEYDFVVALGYQGDSLKEYCLTSFPNHNFTFVNIDDFNSPNSGPGATALKCKPYLQRPFYFTTADCIIDSPIPHLDGNWLGVYPTSYPEKYSTVQTDSQDNIIKFTNKNTQGYDQAFIGLASIWDYNTFWEQLEINSGQGEVVSAFLNPEVYSSFKTKQLKWLDTGNLDDLNKTKLYFNDNPLSLYKETDEITYKENKFIKFNPLTSFIKNKEARALALKNLIPSGFSAGNNFISYDWEPGDTVYNYNSLKIYNKFLEFFSKVIKSSQTYTAPSEIFDKFYTDKTLNRKQKFLDKFGNKYLTQKFTINGVTYPSLAEVFTKIKVKEFYQNPLYTKFHGDLQFDNILYNEETDKFTYIDWRESFGGSIKGGDIYYDLAKLYGGCIIPYNIMKQDNSIKLSEGDTIVSYSYTNLQSLSKFKATYENWIISEGYDLNKIKTLTALIFLNMSPLHDEKFGKMLWFKCIEILSDVN